LINLLNKFPCLGCTLNVLFMEKFNPIEGEERVSLYMKKSEYLRTWLIK